MFTIQDYIDSLNRDKESLVANLTTKGISCSDSETFTTLVPKVLDIVTPNLQSKSETITANTTTLIEPESGYNGLSSVSITTNVEADMSEYISPIISAGTNRNSGYSGWDHMLKKIPATTTVSGTSLKWAFSSIVNTSLTQAPYLDTSQVTNMEQMFYGSAYFTTIPLYNTSSVTTMQGAFSYINGLTDTSLDNILQMCINATNYTETKTLSSLGITNATYYPTSRIQALPHYQDFINAGWTIS